MRRATIAICTYKRPIVLARAIDSLHGQVAPDGWHIDLLVVDNDECESARAVTESFSRNAVRPLRYVVEPSQGVGTARNRALDESSGCDALIFFDDDQVPNHSWLTALLAAHESDPKALWTGPVQPGLPEHLPAWAKDGWPWRRPNHPDGSDLSDCGNGNLLIPRSFLVHDECRYSAEFRLGVGEDTELTSRLVLHGARIRYCSAASAIEPVTAERMDPSWTLDRASKSAAAWAKITLPRERGMERIFRSGCKRLISAMALSATGHLLGRADLRLKGKRDLAIVRAYLRVRGK